MHSAMHIPECPHNSAGPTVLGLKKLERGRRWSKHHARTVVYDEL